MARLVIPQSGEVRDWNASDIIVGRAPESDIVLSDATVSASHVRITKQGDTYYVEDLDSTNGTRLNGDPVSNAVPIRHQDTLELGTLVVSFEHFTHPRETIQIQSGDALLGTTAIHSAVESMGGFGLIESEPQAKLRAIIEISRRLVETVELESILPKVLETLFEICPYADRGCILLRDESSGELKPHAFKHKRELNGPVQLSRTIIDKVIADKQGLLSADAIGDPEFSTSKSVVNLEIRSMMCVPMLSLHGEPIGIIHLDTEDSVHRFTRNDLELLMAVAGQAALSCENARLQSLFAQQKRQDMEMAIARDVQRALLPRQFPQVEGYSFFAHYDSASAVGGDYYDCIPMEGNRICLAFGDVAGKGVPGAIVMSRLSMLVRSTMSHVQDAGTAICTINDQMCQSSREGSFVTFILLVIDARLNTMTTAIAGHGSPIVRRTDGTVEMFDNAVIGIPIGIQEGYRFQVTTREIKPGDTVLLVTDGVDEAMNPSNELYGEQRLHEFVRTSSTGTKTLCEGLLEEVRRHADGRPQNDDIAIMAFSRLELSESE